MVSPFLAADVCNLLDIQNVSREVSSLDDDEKLLYPMIILIPTFWGYLFTEYIFQRSFGKMLTGTKVVSVTGSKPTLKQILFRTLSRSIPLEYLSYLTSVEGIHDKLSKTRVVKK